MKALEAFAGPELMLPEQVWDGPPLPGRGLEPGRPTGSCAPLGWAHAEYLKLLAALATGSRPDAVAPALERYAEAPPQAPALVWHPAHAFGRFPAGRRVLVQLEAPGVLRWSGDGWASYAEVGLIDAGLELWVAELPTAIMRPGASIEWTARHPDGWEGANHRLECAEPGAWEH